ncbi:tripartite tricarboxylate transporter substrate binding protein [Roseomonas sp. NAR14]|uniref:Tripartite tricarboxylate transporter substrate binding protein n=1 Tax=Roseomonas acroporae TaxID=2937791 RepID=A0A9X1YHX0_9PROT|nr:tripartite tricarboxylate transporter substrate binding protein [Roseomonas acroporae]MCK8786466.1 tripartite tricarboxylate transporter substrate binding protein [Roseomonas acroporae]
MQRRGLAAALALLAAVRPGQAQEAWPQRTVTLVVPYAPGGSNDVVARLLAPGLQAAYGRSFVVENRTGAGGAIGMAQVARARPDSHLLLVSSASNHVFNHLVVPDQGYDPREALVAMSMLVDVPNALAVHPSVGVADLAGLLAKLRTTPGGVSFASSGVGSSNHLAGELFRLRAGVPLNHVPYRGGGPALTDLIAGTVPIAFLNLPTLLPAHEAGQVRILGVGSRARLRSRPELPTIAEGGVPDYEVRSWTGLFAPRGTPQPVLERMAAETRRLLEEPAMQARLAELGSDSLWMDPDATDAYVRAEFDRWGPIVRQAGVTNN